MSAPARSVASHNFIRANSLVVSNVWRLPGLMAKPTNGADAVARSEP
jgi:hypothetical protein